MLTRAVRQGERSSCCFLLPKGAPWGDTRPAAQHSTAQRAPPGEEGQIHGFWSWADPYEADGILAHPTAPEPSAADLKRKGGFIQHGPKPRAERSLEVHRIPSFPSKALFSSFLPRVKTLPLNGQIQA